MELLIFRQLRPCHICIC